jgi:hypothetical protein
MYYVVHIYCEDHWSSLDLKINYEKNSKYFFYQQVQFSIVPIKRIP